MAMARPVIATSVALEGIAMDEGGGVQTADESVRFAELCVRLLLSTDSPDFARSRQWICQRYDWERNLERLQELIEGHRCQGNPAACASATG